MLEKHISGEFSSYEEFYQNLTIHVPENFNFAYDVVDRLALESPDQVAMVWCDTKGDKVTFTFGQLKYYSDKTANIFKSWGIKKGDPVMLILKRRYEFWFSILALHKIGAVGIPATHLLTTKDIVYRNNAADVKMIVAVHEDQVMNSIDEAEADSPSLAVKVAVGGSRSGWRNFDEEIRRASTDFTKPTGEAMTENTDRMLLYFTSGTTGYPKMVQHNFLYPLGLSVTAKYWQNVREGGLHLTVAETGWAKAAWGKIYGQWLAGSAIFVYDFDKFVPAELLQVIADNEVTTFCAPPTIYRYFIKEDLTRFKLETMEYCVVAGEPLN
ncbi:MAG TPA: AMP-binding protein, partial [Bacillota bacterium]|nr:AMP-binding protein [Bacillota bacterium]